MKKDQQSMARILFQSVLLKNIFLAVYLASFGPGCMLRVC